MSASGKDPGNARRDRVAQVYLGMVKSGESGDILRQRIDWMVEYTKGEKVLDVGCSEGVLEILLARKGCNVTGVDIDAEALSFARELLAREPEAVRARVRLNHGDLLNVQLPLGHYDTVLIGEVLEHLANPDELLDRSLRFVRPDGRLIITTPFGYHPHQDHKQAFFLSNFIDLVRPRCALELLQVEGGYIRLVGRVSRAKASSWKQVDRDQAINMTEAAILSSQRRLYGTIDRHRERVKLLETQIEGKKERAARLQEEIERGKENTVQLQNALEEERQRAVELEKGVDKERRRAAQFETKIAEERDRAAELRKSADEEQRRAAQAIKGERRKAAQLQKRIDEERGRAAQLQKRIDEERHRAAQFEKAFDEEQSRAAELLKSADEERRRAAQATQGERHKAAQLRKRIDEERGRAAQLWKRVDEERHRTAQFERAFDEERGRTVRLQKEVDEERRKASRLRSGGDEQRRRAGQLQKEVNEERRRTDQLRRSVRWQLGTLLVGAVRRPWRIVRLPIDLVHLSMNALGHRRRASAGLSTSVPDTSSQGVLSPSPAKRTARQSPPAATHQARHREIAGTPAASLPSGPSAEATMNWILGHVEGHRVAVIGCQNASLFRSLERRRLAVTAYEFAFSDAQPVLIERNEQAEPDGAPVPGSGVESSVSTGSGAEAYSRPMDTAIICGVPHPSTMSEDGFRCLQDQLLRDGGRIVVTLSQPTAISADGIGVDLMSFLAAVRANAVPEHLSIENDELRFVGRLLTPGAEVWPQFEAGVWPQLMRQTVGVIRNRHFRELSSLELRLQALLESTSYRAGRVLVTAAKQPSTSWKAPLRLWRLYRASQGATLPRRAPLARSAPADSASFPPMAIPPARGKGAPVVAAILDSFSEYCLRYELDLVLLTPKHWRRELEQSRPEFLLVESAWAGNDGAWRYMIGDHDRESSPLRALLRYCREHGIPTVFWNKEDPPNFDYFIDAAKEFDVVFTTAAECVPKYREICGHDRVYVMPFASQPRLHNPCRQSAWPRYPVCFAGSWTEKYPDRCEALRQLLDPALPLGLHIFDRNLNRAGKQSLRYRFPDRYQPVIKGTLRYNQMLTAYRCYDVMMNSNSVADSATMFSRRVFESLACGTPVISTDSIGMREMLGDHVRVARDSQDAAKHLNELLNDEEGRKRAGHLAYRYVHEHHSYRNRVEDLLSKVGVRSAVPSRPSVSVVVATCRSEFVKQALRNYVTQCYENKELVLVFNNGAFDLEAVRAEVDAAPNVHVLHVEGRATVGACLNRGVELASGDYIARMDDDDDYGERYLSDMMLAARFSEADILGKGSYFVHVKSRNTMALRELVGEHCFGNLVVDATLVAGREVLRTIPFPERPGAVGAELLGNATREGCRIYSGDVFNYLHVRRADPAHHAWTIDDGELLKDCRNQQSGLELERVMI